jgi:hypothetical protein
MQGRAKLTLVPGERALRLPAAFVLPVREPAVHLAAVLGLRSRRAAAAIQRDDGRADAEAFAAQAMVGFAVVGAVGEQAVREHGQRRLLQGRLELRAVVAGAAADRGGGEKVAGRVADDGELGPEGRGIALPAAQREVARDAAAVEAGGVEGGLGLRADQAAFDCGRGGPVQEDDEVPLFKSRCSA